MEMIAIEGIPSAARGGGAVGRMGDQTSVRCDHGVCDSTRRDACRDAIRGLRRDSPDRFAWSFAGHEMTM